MQALLTNEDLNVAIARLQERTEAMACDIHEIRDALIGNGVRPGLVERTTITEQRVIGVEARLTSLEARGTEASRMSWKALMALIGLAATLATAMSALINHLGNVPTP